jgi:hypothetical protein
MSHRPPSSPSPMHRRHALATLGALASAAASPAWLSACGGGGDAPAAVGGGATPSSFLTGPISGLGSIIVNGVRFDDSSARIESDDDGSMHSARELALGMMVEIESSRIDDNAARAVATLIRFGSEMVGAVTAVNTSAQTISMLDQTIEVRAETVFDPSITGGLGVDLVGQILEIHALFDASTGRYIATRIEREDSATVFKLRGLVSALDTTAKTFAIGAAVINYASVPADQLPVAFANGQRVRVRLQPDKVNGQWMAITVRTGVRRVDDSGDARVIGLVTAFTSPQQFSVQGIPVDASSAAFEPDAAAVKLGALVQVRGTARNGTLVASRVKAVDMRNDDGWKLVELHGSVTELDSTAKTFMLREIKVDYGRVLQWKNGQPGDLANGKAVEVKGAWSPDRRVLVAGIVEFE